MPQWAASYNAHNFPQNTTAKTPPTSACKAVLQTPTATTIPESAWTNASSKPPNSPGRINSTTSASPSVPTVTTLTTSPAPVNSLALLDTTLILPPGGVLSIALSILFLIRFFRGVLGSVFITVLMARFHQRYRAPVSLPVQLHPLSTTCILLRMPVLDNASILTMLICRPMPASWAATLDFMGIWLLRSVKYARLNVWPAKAIWSVLPASLAFISMRSLAYWTAPPILPYTSLISKPACAISTALVLSSDKSALVYAN